jgi:CcmD family protein
MNAIKFLIAAYVATWVIHGFYIGTLVTRFAKLRDEIRQSGKRK